MHCYRGCSILPLRWVYFPILLKSKFLMIFQTVTDWAPWPWGECISLSFVKSVESMQALDQLPNIHKGCARWLWHLRESSKCWLCPLGLVSVRGGTVWKWALCMLKTSWEVSISCIGVWQVFRQTEICTERRHDNPNQVVGSVVRVHLKFKSKYCGAKK